MCALLPFSYLKFNMKHMAVRTAHLRTYLNRLFLCPKQKEGGIECREQKQDLL